MFLAGENNGIAFADSPAGPFKAVANLTWAGGPPPSAAAAAAVETGGGAGSVLELKRRERCGPFDQISEVFVYQNRSFCQDGLGTHIGKDEGKAGFLQA